MSVLKAEYKIGGHNIEEEINRVLDKKPRLRTKYRRPDPSSDRLYISSFKHAGGDDTDCAIACGDTSKLIGRRARTEEQDDPTIHFGLVASANQLMKDATIRDKISAEKDVLCFEMEAAGLMNQFPCLVIRGICDYSDTHKNDNWQGYAAMAAAAYAKDLLRKVAPNKVGAERKLAEVLSNVNDNMTSISSTLRDVQSGVEVLHVERQHDCIARWLGAPDVSSNFNNADQISHPGSGQRLIQGELYQSWKTQEKSFLWLHGIPGCGKTILTSTIIKDLSTTPECGRKILYFYFDFTDVRKQTFEKCVRSLLGQIYHADGSDRRELDSLYSSCRNGKEQPSMSSLQETFVNMVQQAGGVWIILDALDECPSRAGLLSWLRQLVSSELHVLLLVTSRPEQDIQSALKPLLSDGYKINVQDDVIAGDIYNYVNARIAEHESLSRWEKRPDLQAKIKSTILSKANGMFRWVACQFDALEDCYSPDDLLDTLEGLPETLGGTYERILANIPRKHMHYTRRLLQFLTYSERPLRLDEAVDVIAVTITDDEIRGSHFHPGKRMPIPSEITRYCSSLVVLVEKTSQETHRSAGNGYDGNPIVREIQLAHFSVKDYLVSDLLEKDTAAYLQVIPAQSAIAEVCLTYLSEIEHSGATSTRERFPFAQYAAQYWARHAVVADRKRHRLFKLAEELFSNHDRLQSWYQLYNPDRPWQSQPKIENIAPALYYASLEGLSQCVHALLGKGFDVNAQGGEYGNALYAASSRGHWSIVQLLVENGADIDARGGRYGSALHAAIFRGHQEITQLLLDKGADINIKGTRYNNPLHAAVSKGHRKIVQLLIKNRADVNTQEGEHGNVLQAALYKKNLGIVRILLDHGADANTQGGEYGSALQAASSKKHLEIIRMLLDYEANANTQGGKYGSTLQAASSKNHLDIVRILLDHRADANTQGGKYGNALQAASYGGHREIVQILLDNKADVNAQSGYYGNALQAASYKGHQDILLLLLNKGAKVSAEGGHFGNALQAAFVGKHWETVQLLNAAK